jgi:hypothetical protein
MNVHTSDVLLLSRIIAEYSLMVDQVEKAVIENEYDLGWASAFIAVSGQFHTLLSEFQVEVAPPPVLTGTRQHPIIRQMVQ